MDADLNKMLLETQTAAPQQQQKSGDVSSSLRKLQMSSARRAQHLSPHKYTTSGASLKRGRQDMEGDAADEGETFQPIRVDFDTSATGVGAPQPPTPHRASGQRPTSSLPTAEESARLACEVLEYVLGEELGGHGNAPAVSGLPPPSRAALIVERASLRPAAALSISHVRRQRGTACQRVHEPAPAAVVERRRALRLCDLSRDVTGGATGPNAPGLRAQLLTLFETACSDPVPQ